MSKKWESQVDFDKGIIVVYTEDGISTATISMARMINNKPDVVYLLCPSCHKCGEPVTFGEFLTLVAGQREFACVDCNVFDGDKIVATQKLLAGWPSPNTEPEGKMYGTEK